MWTLILHQVSSVNKIVLLCLISMWFYTQSTSSREEF